MTTPTPPQTFSERIEALPLRDYTYATVCAMFAEADAALRAAEQARETAERERDQLANFNPNWDMLRATQESLREHMAQVATLTADLTRAREDCLKWIEQAESDRDARRAAESALPAAQAQAEALRAAITSLVERAMRELDTAKGKNLMARGMVLALHLALAESAALAPQPSAPAKEEANG